jgi:RHS repeat-associated protein
VKRHDYLPFGEELFAGTAGRTSSLGYVAGDGLRQQFTQKERDLETGLDYFLARCYSATQGRFTSPDEFNGGPHDLSYFSDTPINPTFYAELAAPQSLNKYQYSYNNPLRFVDPDGHQAEQIAQRILTSPAGQQVINAAGAAVTVTIVAASGAAQKAWDWFTTPNPNFKMNTFCSMGLDCSGAYKNQYLNQSNEQNGSSNQGPQQGQGPRQQQTEGQQPGQGQQPSKQNDPGGNIQKLSKGEIKQLQGNGIDIHELKGGKGASRYDLYKDSKGEIYVKRKGGKGEGEATGLNIKDYQ